MEIEFQGRLEGKVIKKAVKLMSKASFWVIALRVAIVLLITVSLGSLIFSYLSGKSFSNDRVLRLVVQDLILGYFIVQPYIASRQLFERLSAGSQTMTGVVTPMGVIYRTSPDGQVIEYPGVAFTIYIKQMIWLCFQQQIPKFRSSRLHCSGMKTTGIIFANMLIREYGL